MKRSVGTAPRAIVLLSGGLDSAVTLAIAKEQRYETFALSFQYGQRHVVELESASRVANELGVTEHIVSKIDLSGFATSALTNRSIEVPRNAVGAEAIPVTYVPARNSIFLAFAAGWAETLGAHDIFIGVNVLDYSGYPDCRPSFLTAFERAITLGSKIGQKRPMRIHAPLIKMTKAEIIQRGWELGLDLTMTHSCYNPNEDGQTCQVCDACLLRSRGFAEAQSRPC